MKLPRRCSKNRRRLDSMCRRRESRVLVTLGARSNAARPRASRRAASHVRPRASPSRRAYSVVPRVWRLARKKLTDAAMFALTSFPPGAPARALGVAERRVARRVRRDARASTTWSLDGVGCAGARSGEHLVGYRRMQSNRDPRRCPLKPIDVSGLCDAHQGKFKMLDAVFEQENGQLFVHSAKDAPDAPTAEDRCASTARASDDDSADSDALAESASHEKTKNVRESCSSRRRRPRPESDRKPPLATPSP